ncbi:MAG: hypothetical protein EPN43_06930, partial [Jatrophihabitans sp.]
MRVPVRSLAVVAAAAATLLAVAPASATPAPPTTTTNPAAAAAGWLAGQFSTDHITVFGDTAGSTASALFGLAESGTGSELIHAAASYLAANAVTVADLGATATIKAGAVAKIALAEMVAGNDPRSVVPGHDLVAALQGAQCMPSTVPACSPIGAGNNIGASIDEALILMAQSRAALAYATPAPSADAIGYFLRLRSSDGAFTWSATPPTDTSNDDVDSTGFALMALQAITAAHQIPSTLTADVAGAITAAKAWLVGQRTTGGFWQSCFNGSCTPSVDSSGTAAAGLAAVGADVSATKAWIVSQQITTGPTFGATATRGALSCGDQSSGCSNAFSTWDGLLALGGTSLATLTAANATPGTAVLALAPATTSASTVIAGGQLTARAAGLTPGEQVAVTLHSAPVGLGTVTADPAGTASITFTVPATVPPGTHTVSFAGLASGLVSTSGSFTVLA